jgi:hypothetical protein
MRLARAHKVLIIARARRRLVSSVLAVAKVVIHAFVDEKSAAVALEGPCRCDAASGDE